jgi:hypothetical protein
MLWQSMRNKGIIQYQIKFSIIFYTTYWGKKVLSSKLKDVDLNYISFVFGFLNFQVGKVEVKEVDFNSDFITRMLPKIDWTTLQRAAKEVSVTE